MAGGVRRTHLESRKHEELLGAQWVDTLDPLLLTELREEPRRVRVLVGLAVELDGVQLLARRQQGGRILREDFL